MSMFKQMSMFGPIVYREEVFTQLDFDGNPTPLEWQIHRTPKGGRNEHAFSVFRGGGGLGVGGKTLNAAKKVMRRDMREYVGRRIDRAHALSDMLRHSHNKLVALWLGDK